MYDKHIPPPDTNLPSMIEEDSTQFEFCRNPTPRYQTQNSQNKHKNLKNNNRIFGYCDQSITNPLYIANQNTFQNINNHSRLN